MNYFYDLPDEIIQLIYKEYFTKYVLSINFPESMGWFEEWNGYGIYELAGTNDANLYKHNFTIWNGSKFEWKSIDEDGTNLRQDWTDDYGTKECPIKCWT
tara:strand:+ start:584 stop:883 length:300 start_codon:yes stop_codon:yes gene_type:complete